MESAARDVFVAGFKPRPFTCDEHPFERGIGPGSHVTPVREGVWATSGQACLPGTGDAGTIARSIMPPGLCNFRSRIPGLRFAASRLTSIASPFIPQGEPALTFWRVGA